MGDGGKPGEEAEEGGRGDYITVYLATCPLVKRPSAPLPPT